MYLVELFVIYWQHLLVQCTPAFQWLYLLPARSECCKLLNLEKAAFNCANDSQLCILGMLLKCEGYRSNVLILLYSHSV